MKQKSEELNKLSIVIPTFDRQKYALRSMKYWSDNGVPQVHVLDGSKEPIEQKYLEDLGENLFLLSLANVTKINKYWRIFDDTFHNLDG